MTLAERVQLQRADEQMALPCVPDPAEARRVQCACGCGAWFYVEKAFHRPVKYATPACRLRIKRRKMAAKRARERAAPPEYVAEVLAPVRERLGGLR